MLTKDSPTAGTAKHDAAARTPPELVFEDRLWPVNLVIFLLAGSVIGVILAAGDFRDPRVLLNGGWLRLLVSGWGLLAGAVVTLLGLLIAVITLHRATVRRIQFCTLVSLLLHLWLAMFLHSQYLPIPWDEEMARRIDDHEPAVMPDYQWEHLDQPDVVQTFETPVETKSPDPEGQRTEEQRKIEQEAATEKLKPVEPEAFHRPEVNPSKIRRAEMAAPRREEKPAGGQVSRQELKLSLEPGQPVPMPEIKPGGPERQVQPSARAAVERKQMEVRQAPQASSDPIPDARRGPGSVSLARQLAESQPAPDLPETPAPIRRAGRPDLAALAAESPRPLRAAGNPEVAQLDARATHVQRRVEAPRIAGTAEEPVVDPEFEPSGKVARIVSPLKRLAEQPVPIAENGTLPYGRPLSPAILPQLVTSKIEEPETPQGGAKEKPGLPAIRSASTGIGRASTAPPGFTPGPQGGSNLPSGTDTVERPGRVGPPPSVAVRGAGRRLPLGGADLGPNSAAGPPGALARNRGPADLPKSALRAEDPTPFSGPAARPVGRLEMASAGPGPLDAAAGAGTAQPDRKIGGLEVQVEAERGAGGLSRDPAPSIGIPNRRARPQSDIVYDAPGRFVLGKSGGLPSLDGGVREDPRAAFQLRDPGRRGGLRGNGSSDETERAVERGIAFLVRHQYPDGHWALDDFPQSGARGYEQASPGTMNADTAATGLALLAMLGAGYTHLDGPHQEAVHRGVYWLLKNQQPDGRLFTPQTDKNRFSQFYGHAIATIALCEAYGMTGDTNLQGPTKRAIGFVVASQHPTLGGWRYEAGSESDTSVSGWKLMALRSAQMAGLEVPADAFRRVSGWLDSAQTDGGARYMYNPYASETYEQRDGKRPNPAMTAEGLLMRMYLGWRPDNPALELGVRHLLANGPDPGTPERPRRDSYFWYYATQVMFQVQGEAWDTWKARLEPLLVTSQEREGPLAGSWHPSDPVPDRWSPAGGRHYVTALNLLMLEVRYRYLPLYQLEKK